MLVIIGLNGVKKSYEVAKSDTAKIHIIITLVVMVFIFVHSAMSGDVSSSESRFFAEILSSITGISFQVAHFIVRKAAHFTEFAVLGICLTVNFNDYKSQSEIIKSDTTPVKNVLIRHPRLASWIAGTLYACTDEFHQLFVEGRSCEFRDVCIDSAGVVLGIAIVTIVNTIKPVKKIRQVLRKGRQYRY